MGLADLIGDTAQPFRSARPLTEHFAGLELRGVQNEVGMNVLRVYMGGDQHFVVGHARAANALATSCAACPSIRSFGEKDGT